MNMSDTFSDVKIFLRAINVNYRDVSGVVKWAIYRSHLRLIKGIDALKLPYLIGVSECLCRASRWGHVHLVQYFYNQGANVNIDSDYAVKIAAQKGHLEVVEFLHSKGADIHSDYEYALCRAAKYGHLQVVKFLHAKGGQDNPFADIDMALVEAAHNGHLSVVEFLHANGANITECGRWALERAAQQGHLEVVRFLHGNGIDITKCGRWALEQAAHSGHLEVVRYLAKEIANTMPFDFLIESVTIQIGDYIEFSRPDNRTTPRLKSCINRAICYGAIEGHLEVVRFLHEFGADVTYDNNRPIRNAVMSKNLELVRYLVAAGADVGVNGDVCLMTAVRNGDLPMVQFLIGAGIDTNPNHMLNSALSVACHNGKLQVARYLVMLGANVQTDNNQPIRQAAAAGHASVVRFLHGQGADICSINFSTGAAATYTKIKYWLQTQVSELKRLAAKCYVLYYQEMPDADSVPTDVLDILAAANY